MIVIVKRKTKIAKVTVSVCENPTLGSWGSHQLLLDGYRQMDDCWTKTPAGFPTEEFRQMEFNTNWLKYMERKYGPLHCEYCGKSNLKIHEWYQKRNLDIIATTDHFLPRKHYPEYKQDIRNLVVSCYTHNMNKKANIVDKSELKYPYPEERIF